MSLDLWKYVAIGFFLGGGTVALLGGAFEECVPTKAGARSPAWTSSTGSTSLPTTTPPR